MWVLLLVAAGVLLLVIFRLRPVTSHEDQVRELLAAVEEAIARDATEQATIELDNLLAIEPDHPKALLYRGQFHQAAGEYEAALELLQRIDDAETGESGTARYLEGVIWFNQNQARMSEASFRKAIAQHPTFVRPYENLALLYGLQDRGDELRDMLSAIREFRPWTVEELVATQLADSPYNQPEANIARLEELAAGDSEDLESRIALARYLANAGRDEDSRELLEQMLEVWPEEIRVRALLVDALLALDDSDGAARLLASRPLDGESHPWWWRSHAHFAYLQEDWPRAEACYPAALAHDPNDFTSAYRYGIALQRGGDTDRADDQLRRAKLIEQLMVHASSVLRGDQSRVELMQRFILSTGRTLVELERYEDSLPWFEFILAAQPDHEEARSLFDLAAGRVSSEASVAVGGENSVDTPIPLDVPARAGDLNRPGTGERGSTRQPGGAAVRFEDEGTAVGLEFQYFNGESAEKYLLDTVGGGVAVLDYDADGCPDLFFPNGCRIPYDAGSFEFQDQMFRNREGRFFDLVTASTRLGSNEFGQGCAAGDFNNDGFVDLFVANYGSLLFYMNNGDGTFQESAEEAGFSGVSWKSSLALCDLDLDGDLDLYTVNYVQEPLLTCRDGEGRPATCSPGNFAGEQDRLHVNDGRGRFVDVTESAGVIAPDGKGLGIVAADLDNDHRPDLYVANDGTPNFLFHNVSTGETGLRFEERGLLTGTAMSDDGRAQAGMGIACGDFDQNGWLDLFVTNFYQDTNILHLNQGNLMFRDETRRLNLADPSVGTLGFGTQPIDADLDGFAELFVANGHIDDRRFEDIPWQMPPQLFQRSADGRFADVSLTAGEYFGGQYIGRGVARLDWNGDLMPDLVVVHQDRNVGLLTNRTREHGNRVKLTLIGQESNRSAIGARIEVFTPDGLFRDEILGGDGFFVTNEPSRIIGIGDATQIEQVRVTWPGGRVSELPVVPVNAHLILREAGQPLIAE